MIHHVSMGFRSVATTKGFYDALLAPLGYAYLRAFVAHVNLFLNEVKP